MASTPMFVIVEFSMVAPLHAVRVRQPKTDSKGKAVVPSIGELIVVERNVRIECVGNVVDVIGRGKVSPVSFLRSRRYCQQS